MKQIEDLIRKMTLAEKAALTIGATKWKTVAIDRLRIPPLYLADGPHGLRRVQEGAGISEKSLPATCFPTASCQAATWNRDLVYAMGEAMAEEALALDVDVILGPGVNIKRTPLGGRNFEYYAEDPYLTGELAMRMIDGIQNKGVGTSLKHFTANNQEAQRFSINAEIDERALREIYLPAFEGAVKKAKPWTVMCAYNQVNGSFCSEHQRLLKKILKEEWGFEGLVISDWGAVHDRVKALQAGLDLEMPGPQKYRVEALVAAIESSECAEADLDDAVRRILRIVFKAQETTRQKAFDQEKNHQLARTIASEGIVLLKNEGLLPLRDQTQIAVIGRAAKIPYYQGGGSSHVNPTQLDTPWDALQELAGDKTWTYAVGYPEGDASDPALLAEAVQVAQEAEVALVFMAPPHSSESEGYDRPDLALPAQQVALIEAITAVQSQVVVVLNSGSPLILQPWLDGVNAVLMAWMMGQAGGSALADILLGRVNPSGKLAETFPIALEDTPAYINYPGEAGTVRYGEGIFVGYRYYDAKKAPVQFPFGFGLSYTQYEYSNPQASARFKDVDGLTVSVDVTNTGTMAGREIVQVYVHDHRASLPRPPRELKGFAKVALEPGETKTVTLSLDFRAFAFYPPTLQGWMTEDGDFDILFGASSRDIRQTITTTLISTVEQPSSLHPLSTLREWLADPVGAPVLQPRLAEFQAIIAQEEPDLETGDMDEILDQALELPLVTILASQQAHLPQPAEDIVAGLLQQVHGKA